jgi:hypothetical protein
MILPDFIIIGAMKAGTTTLYEYLSRHPQVGMSREKETDFFVVGRGWECGLPWYQAQFAPGRQVYGEASPNYTKCQVFPGVPGRVAGLIPAAKLIFIARDPVARAASQYRHAVLSGEPVPAPERLIGSAHLQHLIDCSSYAAQMDPWLAVFPRENFLFLQFEALIDDPGPGLAQVADFLGIRDDWPASDAIAANSADSLARLPPWLFALRKMRAAGWIKRVLSAEMRGRLKGMVTGKTARVAPDLPPDVLAYIGAALAADRARFAVISGL